MKILILKPSSLGDVVQALPVLRLLKRHDPSRQIYWWLSRELCPLLAGDPDLAGLFPFDRRGWAAPRNWRRLARTLWQMRQQRFDWVIDLQSLARSAVVAWLARGRWTVGLEDLREGAPTFYDCAVPRPTPHTHAVEWYLAVLARLRVPIHWDFEWLPRYPQAAGRVRPSHRNESDHWIILHPGARWANKRWPVEYFRELVRLLAQDAAELRFAVLGNGAERELGRVIADAVPGRCLDLTGRTTLPEMVEWIRQSDLMVTNDSGPMHVAAALGKPVVALFGPTDPARTGPYGQTERVLRSSLPCVPCLRARCHYSERLACLRRLAPSQVAAEVRRRLRQAGAVAGHRIELPLVNPV